MSESILSRNQDEICAYCEWTLEGCVNSVHGMCEGRWCAEAAQAYDEAMRSEQEDIHDIMKG